MFSLPNLSKSGKIIGRSYAALGDGGFGLFYKEVAATLLVAYEIGNLQG